MPIKHRNLYLATPEFHGYCLVGNFTSRLEVVGHLRDNYKGRKENDSIILEYKGNDHYFMPSIFTFDELVAQRREEKDYRHYGSLDEYLEKEHKALEDWTEE